MGVGMTALLSSEFSLHVNRDVQFSKSQRSSLTIHLFNASGLVHLFRMFLLCRIRVFLFSCLFISVTDGKGTYQFPKILLKLNRKADIDFGE